MKQFFRHAEDLGVHRIVNIKRFQRHRAVDLINQVSIGVFQIEMLSRQTVIFRERIDLGRRNFLERLYDTGFDEMFQIGF